MGQWLPTDKQETANNATRVPFRNDIRQYQGNYVIRIFNIGDHQVGKSKLMHRYIDGKWEVVDSRIGLDFKSKVLPIEYAKVTLQVWALQSPRFQVSQVNFTSSNGIALIVDLTTTANREFVDTWFIRIKQYACKNVCVALVGTKADLEKERKWKTEDLKALATEYGVKYFEVSAKTGLNVDLLYDTLVKDILFQYQFGDYFMSLYSEWPHTHLSLVQPCQQFILEFLCCCLCVEFERPVPQELATLMTKYLIIAWHQQNSVAPKNF